MSDEGYLQNKIRELQEEQISMKRDLKEKSLLLSSLVRIIDTEIKPKLELTGPIEDILNKIKNSQKELEKKTLIDLYDRNAEAIQKAFSEYQDQFEKIMVESMKKTLDEYRTRVDRANIKCSAIFTLMLSKNITTEREIRQLVNFIALPKDKQNRKGFRKTKDFVVVGSSKGLFPGEE